MRKPALCKLLQPFFLSVDALRMLPEEELRAASGILLRDWCATASLFDADDDDECLEALLTWRASYSPPHASGSAGAPIRTGSHSQREEVQQPIPKQQISPSSTNLPLLLSEVTYLDTPELLRMTRSLPGGELPEGTSRRGLVSALLHAGVILDQASPRTQNSASVEGTHQKHPVGTLSAESRSVSTTYSELDRGLRQSFRLVEHSDGSHAVIQSHVEDTRVLAMLTRDVPNRFSDLLGIQGKYSSDATCGNCQFFLHPDDRRLLGVQKSHLKFLLGLLFIMDFSHKSPSGTHIQAFNGLHGERFRYVYQIHTALSRLARVLDSLVCSSAGPYIFQPVLDPLLRMLQSGDVCGLQRLPVDVVVDAVSEALMKMGHSARSGFSDSWSRETLVRELSAAATVDVSFVIQRASIATLAQNRDFRDGSRKRFRSPSDDTNRRPAHSNWDTKRVSTDRHRRSASRNLCLAALRKHLSLAERGCEKASCGFDHDIHKASKEMLLKAAESFYKAEIRTKAIAAINNMHG